MTSNTTILLLISVILAGGLSYFQYFYKAKSKSKLIFFLAFLRFLSIFGILLLLINPIINKKTLDIIKPSLPIIVDNSSSIQALNAQKVALEVFDKLKQNKELQKKFDIQCYSFDSQMETSEEFSFKGNQTNIDAVAKGLKNLYRSSHFPTVILTDGNQTLGNEYSYSFDKSNSVFPVVLGDTTTVFDLKINQLNVNKYVFQKNKFPVEVFLSYSGNKNTTAEVQISQGTTVVSNQKLSFSKINKSAVVNFLIPANKIGVQVYKATIVSKAKEKNNYNNIKNFAVNVINQTTNIAVVSSINHPDIGALKRAIETNAQRNVTLLNPNKVEDIANFNIVILYQPTKEFKTIFEKIKILGTNHLIITGMHTDFNFLNQYQSNLVFKMSNQPEDYLAGFNKQFNLFALDNFGFENYPPLQNPFGTVTTKGPLSILLFSKIRSIGTNTPLLVFAENLPKRSAYLLGENTWKWRMQCYLDHQNYEKYDVFVDKIIQFLATNDAKKFLIVNHENFYNSGETIEISAQYFNKNYEFDEKANLTISIKNTKTNQIKNYDLLRSTNAFKVNLDGLSSGQYKFTVKELNSGSIYTNNFEILDFDIEKQFVNPDLEKLNLLAQNTQAKLYFPNQIDNLIEKLLIDDQYKSVQKETITRTPLIEWYWLLIILIILLSIEWFTRKYNGLI